MMAESRQLSVRLSDEVFAGLEKMRPPGVTLAEVARKIITKLVLEPGLPLLQPEDRRVPALVDFSVVLETIAGLEETQRETLRAVQEHGSWIRYRIEPRGNADLDRKALNAGEQAVRDWERSMGRES